MFACATYPRNENFLHEVALEVQETALRLGSHPRIFVFGGNNENEVGLEWY
jgi:beta-mannosidase